jgi:hypothetical protein
MADTPFTPDFGEAIRPVLFQTELEEFLYATHGGTLFVVRFNGRLYGVTCKHVFREFGPNRIFIANEKQAQKGSKPAPVKTLCFPSSPRDGAVETDVEDICVIEFEDDIASDFFKGSGYSLNERPFGTSRFGNELLVSGVLKEKTHIDPPDITIGYCRLEFRDFGATSDSFLRLARAEFWKPQFGSITGISGSPVFDRTANALCGMVIRGGMNGTMCEIRYVDIADIAHLLEAVNRHAPQTYYRKNVVRPIRT